MVVSAFSPAHGARAVDALAEGAFELVAKPAFGEPLETFTSELGRKVGEAAHSGRVRVRSATARSSAACRPSPRTAVAGKKVVVIACSTGGPKALGDLIPQLPSPLGAGTPDRPAHAARLHRLAGHPARRLAPATWSRPPAARRSSPAWQLMAPGGLHLRLDGTRRARPHDDAPIGGLKPRADLTIEDAAKLFGPACCWSS